MRILIVLEVLSIILSFADLSAAQAQSVQQQLTAIQQQLNHLEQLILGLPVPKPDTRRLFYLSNGSGQGSFPLTACVAGFHFASLWEILEVSTLKYDVGHGVAQSDNGQGPPSGRQGWVRTGNDPFTGDLAGAANCNVWTLNAGQSGGHAVFGSTAGLRLEWVGEVLPMNVWDSGIATCDTSIQAWCVQD